MNARAEGRGARAADKPGSDALREPAGERRACGGAKGTGATGGGPRDVLAADRRSRLVMTHF